MWFIWWLGLLIFGIVVWYLFKIGPRPLVVYGVVSLVASDALGFGRPPRVDTAYATVEAAVGRDAAMPLFDGSAIPWLA